MTPAPYTEVCAEMALGFKLNQVSQNKARAKTCVVLGFLNNRAEVNSFDNVR